MKQRCKCRRQLSMTDFAVEQLVAQASVEALDVAVLPGAASLDVGGLGTDNRDPFLYRLGEAIGGPPLFRQESLGVER